MKNKLLDKLLSFTPNAQSISGMDAAFLYAETPTSPMNVGSVVVIEGSLEFEDFKKMVHSRIHDVPKLRQRLMYVPLSIDYPYWVDDPDFDIDLHIKHIALPKPGGWRQLRDVASTIFSSPLDQNRPLWSMTFVEGLDSIPQVPKGSVAVVAKIHHVAIDGMAGAGLLSLFLDFTADKKPIPEPKPYNPEPLPNEIQLMMKSATTFAADPFKFPRLVSEMATATVKAGFLTRVQKQELPTAPFTAPNTPLNGILAPRRRWNTAILSLERIITLKKVMGTTVNDVMLAICAGALRRYLDEKGKLPAKSLVAMVPISVRDKDDTSTDNQLSAMLIQLATNIADPIERLEAIHENSIRGKTYQNAVGAKTLGKMAEAVPFGVANQAARLYSRFQVAKLHNPVFNVAITNVPGPSFPLYINGHQVLSIMGTAPIIDGMGLIITILSYNGLVTISPFSDLNSMPDGDLDDFTRYLRESANELEAAILAFEKKKKKAAKKGEKPQSEKLFKQLGEFLAKMPDNGKPKSGVFQFKVSGNIPSEWVVDISKYPGEVTEGRTSSPDAIFSVEEEHLLRIAGKELDVQTAFIQGRLKVDGDFNQAMRLAKILGKMLEN
jgi:diacylglycerol O-acyltransferase / wax synthase